MNKLDVNVSVLELSSDPISHLENILSCSRALMTSVESLLAEKSEIKEQNSVYNIAPEFACIGIDNTLLEAAMRIYKRRRKREKIFDSYQLFGEPAWDILLDLFISLSTKKRVSVTSVCYASQVPSTTALRWLCELEKKGLVNRTDDSTDRRRSFISLSQKGNDLMVEYLSLYLEPIKQIS